MPLPGQRTSYAEHAPTGIPLTPNSYVLLRVGGTLQAVRNPYILDTKPGDGPISYSAFESYEATARGATHLWLLGSGGTWVPPAGGEILTGYFRPDPGDARDMILLVRVGPTPAQLWSHRDPLPGRQLYYYCFEIYPYCSITEEGKFARPGENNGQWIENYWLQQSHTVTATAIPEPLTVDGPDAVSPGDTATFTATPWGSLRLRNQVGILPRVWWIWYPNDTTAVPNPKVRPEILFCRGPSCPFAPAQSGRLRVQTFVEGAPVDAERIVKLQQHSLELSCPDSVERGSSARCTARAVPSGTLDSIRWTFTDTAGIATTTDTSGTADWAGKMVMGGRVSVSARLNDTPVAADTPVAVSARTWPRMTVVAHDSGNGHLPARPRVPRDLADTHPVVNLDPFDTELIGSGPNAGWWYIKSPVTRTYAPVHISSGFKPGTPFYQLQHSGVDPVTGDPFCSKGQLHHVETGARRHEGLLASSLVSHIEVYELWFSTNSPQVSMERIVLHRGMLPDSNFTFAHWVEAEFVENVSQPSAADPNQRHTTDIPPGLVAFPPVPCRPRFFP